MKTTVFILFCFLTFSASKAQVNDLIGSWTVFEMTQTAGENSEKMSEDQLKTNEAFQDFVFMEEAKFKQTGNLSGQGTVSTQEGTWQTTGNKVIITLRMGERNLDVDYTYELKENNLFLTRTSPDGNIKITMACRKK